jgi:hypothetical protein
MLVVHRLLAISIPKMLAAGERLSDIREEARAHVAMFIHDSHEIPEYLDDYIAQHRHLLDPIVEEGIRRAKQMRGDE